MPEKPKSKDFIVVEGPDGIGKSTQIALLNERLLAAGKRTAFYDFPSKSGHPIGDLIGDFLMGKYPSVPPEFLSLAFALDRKFVTSQRAKEDTDVDVVIADRFVLSNIAFQGAKLDDLDARSKISDLIEWVEYDVLQLPRPSLEVILIGNDDYFSQGQHLDREGATDRGYADGKADVHEAAIGLQAKVNAFYQSRPQTERTRVFSIFTAEGQRKAAHDLHEEIWNAVGLIVGLSS